MNTIRIFIASSAELEQDRKEFRDFLSVENERLSKKETQLRLVQWEHFLDAVSQTSLQDEYNKALKECDIVICLFYTKAGKYTQEEFNTALKQFKETGSPLIYTYFKEPEKPQTPAAISTGTAEPVKTNVPAPNSEADKNAKYLKKFKKELGKLGHFFTRYKSIEELKLKFREQLDIMEEKGIIQLKNEVHNETKEAVINYINKINTATVTGDYNITVQDVSGQSSINTGNITNNNSGKN